MFQGSIVALITPFPTGPAGRGRTGSPGGVAHRAGDPWHSAGRHHGESPTLTHDEHCRVVELVVKQVAGAFPVIAGAGSNNPVEAIEYTRYAEQAGADATLRGGLLQPPESGGLFHHFKAVHDATTKPIIVYNIPPRAIVDVQPATLARLAELPRIAGVKDATGDLAALVERQLIKKPFAWLSGEDATAVAYNIGGGQGLHLGDRQRGPKLVAEVQNLTWPASGRPPGSCRTG